jgi:hypothetical protein
MKRLSASSGGESEKNKSATRIRQLKRLQEHCRRLRLFQIEHELDSRLEQASLRELSYADFFDELLAAEVVARTPNQTAPTASAGDALPLLKRIEGQTVGLGRLMLLRPGNSLNISIGTGGSVCAF